MIIKNLADVVSLLGVIQGLKSKKFWAVMILLTAFGVFGYYLTAKIESGIELSNGALGLFGVLAVCSSITVSIYVLAQAWIDRNKEEVIPFEGKLIDSEAG